MNMHGCLWKRRDYPHPLCANVVARDSPFDTIVLQFQGSTGVYFCPDDKRLNVEYAENVVYPAFEPSTYDCVIDG